MHWNGKMTLGASAAGAPHKHTNQDAFGAFENDGFEGIVISDGHGAAVHSMSREGAALAVRCAEAVLIEYLSRKPLPESVEKALAYEVAERIESAWTQAVVDHYIQTRGSADADGKSIRSIKRLYGCTLRFIVRYGGRLFGFHIGDGRTVLVRRDGTVIFFETTYENGGSTVPTSETDSLCSDGAWLMAQTWQRGYSEGEYALIGLFTDGVPNAYPEQLNDDAHFYRMLAAQPEMRLKTALEEGLAEAARASGDDATGVMWRVGSREITGSIETPCSEAVCISEMEPDSVKQLARLPGIHRRMEAAYQMLSRSAVGNTAHEDEQEALSSAKVIVTQSYLHQEGCGLVSSMEQLRESIDNRSKRLRWCPACASVREMDDSNHCKVCGALLEHSVFLKSASGKYELFYDSPIYLHHLMPILGDYDPLIARVVQHPDHPSVWGLKNCGTIAWHTASVEDTVFQVSVEPGHTTAIKKKMRLEIYGLPLQIEIVK